MVAWSRIYEDVFIIFVLAIQILSFPSVLFLLSRTRIIESLEILDGGLACRGEGVGVVGQAFLQVVHHMVNNFFF